MYFAKEVLSQSSNLRKKREGEIQKMVSSTLDQDILHRPHGICSKSPA